MIEVLVALGAGVAVRAAGRLAVAVDPDAEVLPLTGLRGEFPGATAAAFLVLRLKLLGGAEVLRRVGLAAEELVPFERTSGVEALPTTAFARLVSGVTIGLA